MVVPAQPAIPPGSVNEDQLRMGKQRQRPVWFIPFVACKNRPEMTYKVSSGTLNLCSLNAVHYDKKVNLVGRRAFAVHGPMVWNSLPDNLSTQQDNESFRQGLKTWLFSRY